MSTAAAPAVTEAQFQAAQNHLYHAIHVPVFMHKLAQAGIQPRTEQEAAEFLAMGDFLLARDQEQQAKQAAAQGSLVNLAFRGLGLAAAEQGEALSHPAVQVKLAEWANDQHIKAAAAVFGQYIHQHSAS